MSHDKQEAVDTGRLFSLLLVPACLLPCSAVKNALISFTVSLTANFTKTVKALSRSMPLHTCCSTASCLFVFFHSQTGLIPLTQWHQDAPFLPHRDSLCSFGCRHSNSDLQAWWVPTNLCLGPLMGTTWCRVSLRWPGIQLNTKCLAQTAMHERMCARVSRGVSTDARSLFCHCYVLVVLKKPMCH